MNDNYDFEGYFPIPNEFNKRRLDLVARNVYNKLIRSYKYKIYQRARNCLDTFLDACDESDLHNIVDMEVFRDTVDEEYLNLWINISISEYSETYLETKRIDKISMSLNSLKDKNYTYEWITTEIIFPCEIVTTRTVGDINIIKQLIKDLNEQSI
jgi:hypothetical protein